MATMKRITAELSTLAVLYRQQMSPEELILLAEVWTELLSDMSDGNFTEAVRTHCRQSKFFPVPADILKAYDDATQAYRPELCALPEQTSSAEEKHRNAVNSAMVMASLSGNINAKAFFTLETWEEKERLARIVLGDKYPEGKERRHNGVLSVSEALGRIVQ